MYRYKFSIVMAVYNVEPFLEETLNSVLGQDIGFEENIQLLLVDDGSKDLSGKICDAYEERYPNNIQVIHKVNGGVSSARNEGLRYIEGEFVNFLDADDKLSENALSKVYEFFQEHKDETDVVSIPMIFFDGQNGDHILNYKYDKGRRIIDLTKEYDMIQLSLSSAFIKAEQSKDIYFDTRLKYAEDAKICLTILSEKKTLGVVSEVRYLYRKHSGSTISNSENNKAWYIPYLRYFSLEILKCIKFNERIPKFVQFTVMYDLQWRITQNEKNRNITLNNDEELEYTKLLWQVLTAIDDDVILAQKNIYASHKAYILKKKYNTSVELKEKSDNVKIYCHNNFITDFSKCAAKWEFIKIDESSLYLEGYTGFVGLENLDNIETWIDINGEMLPCYNDTLHIDRVTGSKLFGELIFPAETFKINLSKEKLSQKNRLKLYTKYKDKLIERKLVLSGLFFPIALEFKNSYARIKDYLVYIEGNTLCIEQASEEEFKEREANLCQEFLESARDGAVEAIALRSHYWQYKDKAKDLWLISDRINKADDNGEAFFKYMNENQKSEDTYFVLSEESPDYERLKKIGKTVAYRSFHHKLLHLLATEIISSSADAHTMNPFGSDCVFYWDILRQKQLVFLQHGIIKDDLSGWLNKYNQNLKIFVTSVKPEYESVINGNYFYDGSVVKMTGLPRYDFLEDKREKIISIMPTWRRSLAELGNLATTGKWEYSDNFMKSEYFQFYNSLLNDNKLLDVLKEYGYKIMFMPHPNLFPVIDKFQKNELVLLGTENTSYKEVFAKSSLVITDYSSTVFDFAYLRKPVLYCHFDKEEFFNQHTYTQGYFNYERDGLGEVFYDLESIVDGIIEYMKNDCQLKNKYRERIERFYAFSDKNHCQRVYDEIQKLNK